MNKFILIDGNAIVHRAYHGLPPLTATDGTVVNAVYGFFSMLLKILEDIKPQYIAVCFDRKAPTFRKQLYVGYQAQRPKMADDLSPQFPIIHDILETAGVQIFEVDGYEADDLIGTIATQAIEGMIEDRKLKVDVENGSSKIDKKKIDHLPSNFKKQSSTIHHLPSNLEVIIVSGDRDLLQLVNGHVKMMAPVVGITNMTTFDAAKVKEKYGLTPAQFIDYKALVGDNSDGYPGVTGIGPKTASSLLNQYGTFEGIYKNLGSLSQRLAAALTNDIEQASLAKKLATIVTNVPIQFDIAKCKIEDFDMNILKKEFEKLGFKSILKRMDALNGKKVEKSQQAAQDKPPARNASQSDAGGKKKPLGHQLGLL